MASNHIFGSIFAIFPASDIEFLRAGRKVGPGGLDPGRKSGRNLRERCLYKNAPQRVLRGEKLQKVAENAQKCGKCRKVREMAKSRKRLSSGSGPLGARPTWPMGKNIFCRSTSKMTFSAQKLFLWHGKHFLWRKHFLRILSRKIVFRVGRIAKNLTRPT